MKIFVIFICGLIFLFALALLPISIPPYLDFQVIYHADVGLLRGIPIYDHDAQVNMIAQFAKVPVEQVFVVPFPYPPWYALSTLWVALLPIDIAARIWFGFNLIMLFASTWLLTDGWPAARRLFSFVFSIAFLPVLGGLFVGQYSFPVLLGAALLTYAIRREHIILAAIASTLLTFKPHLGGLILLIALVYLWLRKDAFGRRSLVAILLAGTILFAIGFLASPRWPLEYFHSLNDFRNFGDVAQCHICNSAPMAVAGVLGGGLGQAVWFSVGFLILLTGWLVWRWHQLSLDPNRLIGAAVIVTLLASPYLQNYDYLLLIVPLFILAEYASLLNWFYLGLAYLIPFFGFGLFGSAGYGSLIFSTLILFLLAARSFSLTLPTVRNKIISK